MRIIRLILKLLILIGVFFSCKKEKPFQPYQTYDINDTIAANKYIDKSHIEYNVDVDKDGKVDIVFIGNDVSSPMSSGIDESMYINSEEGFELFSDTSSYIQTIDEF